MKERKNMEHTLRRLRSAEPFFWPNPDREPFAETARRIPFCRADIENTADRFRRFAPVIAALFAQTQASSGIIESELIDILAMAQALKAHTVEHFPGRLLLKLDSHLPIAGSVKSRGGVYEVLKHAEELALKEGLLNNSEDDHEKLLSPAARGLFSLHILQVGSTGNLGMSIACATTARASFSNLRLVPALGDGAFGRRRRDKRILPGRVWRITWINPPTLFGQLEVPWCPG